MVLETILSDTFGYFSFNNLMAGEYTVKTIGQSAWDLTTPASFTVNLASNEAIGNIDFGYCQNQENCNQECLTQRVNFNTGIEDFPNDFPFGRLDFNWQLVQTDLDDLSVPRPPHIITPALQHNWGFGSANWISALPSASNANNNQPDENPTSFRRYFCVCEDSSMVHFEFGVLADDELDLNVFAEDGTLLSHLITLDASTGLNFTNPPRPISSDLVLPLAGRYYVQADIRNTDAVVSGFFLEGYLEGSTLLTESCCRLTNSIFGLKFNDGNGNGFQNYELNNPMPERDEGMQGWEIQLCNTSGVVIQSTFTDEWGYYSFEGVSVGDYIVKEVQQSPWEQTYPSSLTYNITLTEKSLHHNLNFGNHCPIESCIVSTTTEGLPVGLRLFPNPALDELSLIAEGHPNSYYLFLYDINGRLLKSAFMDKNQPEFLIDISKFTPGVYLLRLKNAENNMMHTYRFLKSN